MKDGEVDWVASALSNVLLRSVDGTKEQSQEVKHLISLQLGSD